MGLITSTFSPIFYGNSYHKKWTVYASGVELPTVVDGNIPIGYLAGTPAHEIEYLIQFNGGYKRIKNIKYTGSSNTEICHCPSNGDHYTVTWSLTPGV